ncbi:hypothetical protein HNY73_015843 [Argiope bruennichi]|uniref:Uncharacterized protein n=1 Tax=Argiope bruennichi TaxID=94029 RepID=A0A8T0EHA7_ARGBR|nr:hypothetical protein HNY73_015843 [Argiope bruennichi]
MSTPAVRTVTVALVRGLFLKGQWRGRVPCILSADTLLHHRTRVANCIASVSREEFSEGVWELRTETLRNALPVAGQWPLAAVSEIPNYYLVG